MNSELDINLKQQAHVVDKSQKYQHCTPLLKELCWLPTEQQMKFKRDCLRYKSSLVLVPPLDICLNLLSSVFLQDLFVLSQTLASLAYQHSVCNIWIPKGRLTR